MRCSRAHAASVAGKSKESEKVDDDDDGKRHFYGACFAERV